MNERSHSGEVHTRVDVAYLARMVPNVGVSLVGAGGNEPVGTLISSASGRRVQRIRSLKTALRLAAAGGWIPRCPVRTSVVGDRVREECGPCWVSRTGPPVFARRVRGILQAQTLDRAERQACGCAKNTRNFMDPGYVYPKVASATPTASAASSNRRTWRRSNGGSPGTPAWHYPAGTKRSKSLPV